MSVKNRNKLFLITRRYPYGNAEAFLESEIIYLSSAFSEVIIYPSEIVGSCRLTPSNVFIDNTFSLQFKNLFKRFLIPLVSLSFWRSIWKYKGRIASISDLVLLYRYMSGFLISKIFFADKLKFVNNNIVYTYWFNAITHSFVSLRKQYRYEFFIVSRVHRYDLYEGLNSTQKFWPYREFVLSGLDRLFSISDDGKLYLENKYKIKDKIFVSRLGVFDHNGISVSSSNNDISLVSVSRVEPMKRVKLIYTIVSKFAIKFPEKNVKWTHFGDGSDMASLKKLVSLGNISNLSVFLMGSVLNEAIFKFYKYNSVDVFMNLSSSEGVPVSIMEAQSFGIPVLATNVGGNEEIVVKNIGSLVDRESDIDIIVDELMSLIIRNLDRLEIKNVWLSKYNANTNYKEFVENIQSLFLENEQK